MSRKLILLATAAALIAGPAFAQATTPARPASSPAGLAAPPAAKDARVMPWAEDLTSKDLIGKTVYGTDGTAAATILDVVSRQPNGYPEVVLETKVSDQKKVVVVPLTEIFMRSNTIQTNVFGAEAARSMPAYSAKDWQKFDPSRRFGG